MTECGDFALESAVTYWMFRVWLGLSAGCLLHINSLSNYLFLGIYMVLSPLPYMPILSIYTESVITSISMLVESFRIM